MRRRMAPSPPTPGLPSHENTSFEATPAGDHLVVDEVRGQARQGEVALALADDLVPGGERDEVGEPLDRHSVAVTHELGDRVAHRGDLGSAHHASSIAERGQPAASTSWSAPASATSASDLVAVAGDDRDRLAEDPQRRGHLGLADGQRRRHPDARHAALEHEQAALEAGPLDLLGVLGRVELDADHQALAADVGHEAVGMRSTSGRRPATRLLAARARRCR